MQNHCIAKAYICIQNKNTMKKRFYKENEIWYIDLPEFLEQGLGSKANLMMVDGSDDLLDILSENSNEVTVEFSHLPFEGATYSLRAQQIGSNQSLLSKIGHAFVTYGMYYNVRELNDMRIWLCPVTEYVFGGNYPREIFVRVV
jgi:hypothetical protein